VAISLVPQQGSGLRGAGAPLRHCYVSFVALTKMSLTGLLLYAGLRVCHLHCCAAQMPIAEKGRRRTPLYWVCTFSPRHPWRRS